jgi:hypothetical protein
MVCATVPLLFSVLPVAAALPAAANWSGGADSVASCSYTNGFPGSFTCAAVSGKAGGAFGGTCTYAPTTIGALSGVCSVTLSGAVNGLYHVESQSTTVQGHRVVTTHKICSSSGSDGSGVLYFQSLDGGAVAESVPVGFTIMGFGQTNYTSVDVVQNSMSVTHAVTIAYAGTLLKNGAVVHVNGTISLTCGASQSLSPDFSGNESATS